MAEPSDQLTRMIANQNGPKEPKVDSRRSQIQLKVAVIRLDNESPESESAPGTIKPGVRGEKRTKRKTDGVLADSARLPP
ncbi:unnamed protein product [Lasius platythorax]|uniref:Uncharacterized protein n=1 Tax=Lasius platythorax TaxID=488582 RepID=A0AAV2NEE6_9HYME